MGLLSDAWEFVKGTAGKANDYSGLIKTGISALSTYAAFKDQQKKNEMQQAAYDDYMRQAEAAGFEAQAAVDLNLTPMTVSGVPTTKADVTDFTAVAAKGGLMSIPNKQRKRYARGPEEFEVMEMDEEVITPFGLQQETGIDLMGEQVKYNTANPREGAWNVWNSGGINQEIYEFDFEIFFDSGDWMDMLRGQAPATENMQMASDPGMGEGPFMMEEFLKAVREGFTGSYEDYIDQIDRSPADYWGAKGGIAGLRHGGRARYANSDWIVRKSDVEEEQVPRMAQPATREELDIYNNIDTLTKVVITAPDGTMVPISQEDWMRIQNGEITKEEVLANAGYESNFEIIEFGNAKGGLPKRVRKAPGGIMNLGGLEKDYRTTGGFVPIGAYEKKDDVPARLSKNEFVMTADAVRAAGGGSINKGAQRMYDTMKHLEASPQARRMTA